MYSLIGKSSKIVLGWSIASTLSHNQFIPSSPLRDGALQLGSDKEDIYTEKTRGFEVKCKEGMWCKIVKIVYCL